MEYSFYFIAIISHCATSNNLRKQLNLHMWFNTGDGLDAALVKEPLFCSEVICVVCSGRDPEHTVRDCWLTLDLLRLRAQVTFVIRTLRCMGNLLLHCKWPWICLFPCSRANEWRITCVQPLWLWCHACGITGSGWYMINMGHATASKEKWTQRWAFCVWVCFVSS